MTSLLLIVGSLFFVQPHPQKQDTTGYVLNAYHVHHKVVMDGKLDDPAWKKAQWVKVDYEIQPRDGVPAPQKTYAAILYNHTTLYVGMICKDTHPGKIRAHISDRDNMFNDDYAGIILDTYSKNQNAYELMVNPKGIQGDIMRSGNNENDNFDALWYSRAAVNDTGYTVEMAIPFKSLNFPRKQDSTWSIQFYRNLPRNSRYQSVWAPVKLNNPCVLCQDGKLTGLHNIQNSNTVELLPYGMSYESGSAANSDTPDSHFNNGPVKIRAGGSVSYSPNPSLSLNAVINPDFSQVETDATQISINQPFAVYYSEKRPFFMKNADLFNPNINLPYDNNSLFYSRMINDPLLAGKVIQNSGNFSFAFLTADDRHSPVIVPGIDGSSLITTNLNAYTNVLRTKYNFGSDSYVGGLFTTRNMSNAHNYVESLDWNLRLINHYYFTGQTALSNTKEINDTTVFNDSRMFGSTHYDAAFNGQRYGGHSMLMELSRQDKYYNVTAGYESFSPTFQAQEGFVNHNDLRRYFLNQSISYYPGKTLLSDGNLSTNAFWRYDYTGRLRERFIGLFWGNSLYKQTNIQLGYFLLNDEVFHNVFFTKVHRAMINLNSNFSSAISLGGGLQFGRFIYRADQPSLGHGYNLSLSSTIRPTPRLNLDLSYNYSRLSSLHTDSLYYKGDIIRLKGVYNFTSKLFVRFITQYDSFNKQLQIYPLVYYKLNPFTIFYAGVTSYMHNYGDPYGFQKVNRQFFIKFQYLFRE